MHSVPSARYDSKLFQNRMVALKSDPVWTKISRFGHPYPPFDWGSGMGVEDVSREDVLSLGVIKEDYALPPSPPSRTSTTASKPPWRSKTTKNGRA